MKKPIEKAYKTTSLLFLIKEKIKTILSNLKKIFLATILPNSSIPWKNQVISNNVAKIFIAKIK